VTARSVDVFGRHRRHQFEIQLERVVDVWFWFCNGCQKMERVHCPLIDSLIIQQQKMMVDGLCSFFSYS
jgi:hypothetical protein